MARRSAAAVTAGVVMVVAGLASGQTQSGSPSGSTGSGQTAGTQAGSTNQTNTQTRNQNTRTSDRQRDGRARGAEGGSGFFSGSDAFGTRSQGGTQTQGSGADTRPPAAGEPVQRPLDRDQPGVNQRGLIPAGNLDRNFVRNLTPAQRADLARQLALGDLDDDGQVAMSQDRAGRLDGRQGRFDEQGNFIPFDDDTTIVNSELALALRRLELLEQRLVDQNDMLLRRLGQARQLPEHRQVRAIADIMQEMLQERAQVLSYVSELRVAVAEQSGLPASPALGPMGTRTYAAPERYQWEPEEQNRRNAVPQYDRSRYDQVRWR
jgi:hypothetical protein